MEFSLKLTVLVFCFGLTANAKPLNASDEELVFVHALWRHGDRAPNFAWPTDPNQEDAWPQGWGSLSPLGMRMHLDLGRRLRRHLKDFVSRHYVAHELYVRSSDVNRTLTSAISNMIGFFDQEQKANGKDYPKENAWPHGFVPVPIHTVNIENDFLKSMPDTCSRMKAVKKLLKHTPEYKKLEHDNKKLLKTFSKLTSTEVKLKDVFHIHDTLFIEKSNNMSWTKGVTEELYEQIGNLTNEFLKLKYGIGLKPSKGIDLSIELPKLNGGWTLGDMIDRMKQKVECLEKSGNEPKATNDDKCSWIGRLKYFAYSAHEESLASAFRVFGIQSTNYKRSGMPTYASCITVELYRNNRSGEYSVKVNYFPRDEETVEITKDIVGCEKECTLDQFAKRSEVYRLTPNANAYCIGNESLEFGPTPLSPLILLLIALITHVL